MGFFILIAAGIAGIYYATRDEVRTEDTPGSVDVREEMAAIDGLLLKDDERALLKRMVATGSASQLHAAAAEFDKTGRFDVASILRSAAAKKG